MTSCAATGNAGLVAEAAGDGAGNVAGDAAGEGDGNAASMLLPPPLAVLPPPPHPARTTLSIATEMNPSVRTGNQTA